MFNLPSPLNKIFANTEDLPVFFDNLMYGMVELLKCDRCYLYIRDPLLLECQIPHCYCIHPEIPNLIQAQKNTESFYRAATDPLFAAAIKGESAIYIENIEQLFQYSQDCHFWQQYSEQKSLLQGHIFIDGELWGIIQAAQFSHPRPWTKFDRKLTTQIINRITPLTTMYVKRKLRDTVQFTHDGYQ